VTLTFLEFWGRWVDCPAHGRSVAFGSLPQRAQDKCWAALAAECRERTEYERAEVYLEAPKRHQPQQQSSTAATSRKPSAVALPSDDPLKKIEPRLYVEALTGELVPANGWIRCPLPDHKDNTPSFQVLQSHWRCFGCGAGGSIIDLASALYGTEPRGSGYWRLRDLILERLLWAPIHPKGDQ
jgi:hypothetical protein